MASDKAELRLNYTYEPENDCYTGVSACLTEDKHGKHPAEYALTRPTMLRFFFSAIRDIYDADVVSVCVAGGDPHFISPRTVREIRAGLLQPEDFDI